MPKPQKKIKHADATETMVSMMSDAVMDSLDAAGIDCPDCLAEQLAVNLQQIIADAAQQTANDEQSILGELQLLLDDCQSGVIPPPPDPGTDPAAP